MTLDEAKVELKHRRRTKRRLVERMKKLKKWSLDPGLTKENQALREETELRIATITVAIAEQRAVVKALKADK